METTQDIVAKLWSLCHVLRDDGITYNEYVTELTYLLFLKMLAETERENRLPSEYRWGSWRSGRGWINSTTTSAFFSTSVIPRKSRTVSCGRSSRTPRRGSVSPPTSRQLV